MLRGTQRNLTDCPTAGAQVLARVPKVPWHPYHSWPALQCRVPSRSERCLLSNSDRHFFVVLERDSSDLLSVESLSCLVSPAFGLPFFGNHDQVLYDAVVDFLHEVVVHRRDVFVRGWRSWMLEDDKVHLPLA